MNPSVHSAEMERRSFVTYSPAARQNLAMFIFNFNIKSMQDLLKKSVTSIKLVLLRKSRGFEPGAGNRLQTPVRGPQYAIGVIRLQKFFK